MVKNKKHRDIEKAKKKTSLQRYLLECDVVGEEVSLVNNRTSKKLIVQPTRTYPKSTWIGEENDVGILFVEGSSFKVKKPLESFCVGLDENKVFCVKVRNSVYFDNLERRDCSKVVLRLEGSGDEELSEGDLTVVGFKALF